MLEWLYSKDSAFHIGVYPKERDQDHSDHERYNCSVVTFIAAIEFVGDHIVEGVPEVAWTAEAFYRLKAMEILANEFIARQINEAFLVRRAVAIEGRRTMALRAFCGELGLYDYLLDVFPDGSKPLRHG